MSFRQERYRTWLCIDFDEDSSCTKGLYRVGIHWIIRFAGAHFPPDIEMLIGMEGCDEEI